MENGSYAFVTRETLTERNLPYEKPRRGYFLDEMLRRQRGRRALTVINACEKPMFRSRSDDERVDTFNG